MKVLLIKTMVSFLRFLGFKIIGTHNGRIHADETMAMALRKVFLGERHFYLRSREPKIWELCDILIDVGGKNDGKKLFDHHQYKYGLSSAGLTWKYIQEVLNFNEDTYPSITELVSMIDKVDTGEEKAPKFSLPFIVDTMNAKKDMSFKQEIVFYKIVSLLSEIVTTMKEKEEAMQETKEIISSCKVETTYSGWKVMVFPENGLVGWDAIINGQSNDYSDVDAVTWYSPEENQWKAQIPPKEVGSFELVNKGFQPNEKAVFVHANHFFSVWNSLEELLEEN